MKLHRTRTNPLRLDSLRTTGLGFAGILLAACGQVPADPSAVAETARVTPAPLVQIITEPVLEPLVPACGGTFNVDPAKSLAVTDSTILARFPLRRVLDQLLARANVNAGQTTDTLYQQWWGTQASCTTVVGNGFPIQCPRNEAALANVVADADNYTPIGLFNRFDLAPRDGSHCGEYRIVYARNAGAPSPFGRNLIIFEGVLPNPNPSCGLAACCEVAQFWANLSGKSITARAADLETFYFNGISGFEPVVDPTHYGMGTLSGTYGKSGGQIRTNQFLSGTQTQSWQLREFQLARTCTTRTISICESLPLEFAVAGGSPQGDDGVEGGEATQVAEGEEAALPGTCTKSTITTCRLDFKQVTVKNNPFFQLFNDGVSPAFQTDFVDNQVASLAADGVMGIGMSTPNQFNHGQSDEQAFANEQTYRNHVGPSFSTAIRNKLCAVNPAFCDPNQPAQNLTSTNIANRATTQSCAGCHQPAQFFTSTSLGRGVVWPASLGFVHITEQSPQPAPEGGQRFRVSPALTTTFLPHRKGVLESYLASRPACGAIFAPLPSLNTSTSTSTQTLGGSMTH